MKASDYIVEFLIRNGVTDAFGYPGGMVTHLMDSFARRRDELRVHVLYHEQACAFAACAYAQIRRSPGVAFATSGPGATNLLTGVCNAYFDSIPTVFLTGQVNTGEQRGELPVRQRGFQETDIVSIAASVTKMAVRVRDASELPGVLRRAFDTAVSGRPGPVLIDLPMDIQRADMEAVFPASAKIAEPDASDAAKRVLSALNAARRPCLLLGNGVHAAGAEAALSAFLAKWSLPAVTTMPAVDLLPSGDARNFGFLGAYGARAANFILAKADLILSVGARLDIRQTGAHRAQFAPNAQIFRVDNDPGELAYPVHPQETPLCMSANAFLSSLASLPAVSPKPDWLAVCGEIRGALEGLDDALPNRLIRAASGLFSGAAAVAADVGQNQVWTAQSWLHAAGQRMLFSAGHGAMGYALPAAIGAHYASGAPTVCVAGDGGLQMNVQELAYLARENLPVSVVVLNNRSLGMIRHFQELYFDSRCAYTTEGEGYGAPDFAAVAQAYGVPACKITSLEALSACSPDPRGPALFEILLPDDTRTLPKLEFGKPNQDQTPQLDRALYARLMAL